MERWSRGGELERWNTGFEAWIAGCSGFTATSGDGYEERQGDEWPRRLDFKATLRKTSHFHESIHPLQVGNHRHSNVWALIAHPAIRTVVWTVDPRHSIFQSAGADPRHARHVKDGHKE